ncbi:hypothetical protein [Planomicrobium sp. CPCC 101079]|uniref:hypothetical protein n=1 Tax=Planomicrobium sp. CPCC 101079 TaxID=2599618 RepID=UPI0011B622DA|nr:hypothetical protein [Planomicrobium sp. CPCC 101079]TWT01589.1 hypothetical protein FQV28_16085 [Planomicrobium sp. CPCC 101079]
MGLLRFLFFKRKCLVYTAFGNKMYLEAANKFTEHGIPYDTVIRGNANVQSALNGASPSFNNFKASPSQYDFYVAKEDEYRAQQALHR